MEENNNQSDGQNDDDEVKIVRKYKTISKKKVIYVEIDDEITAVYDRVKNLPIKEVYIMAPKRATLLESVINLKILKKKLSEIDKEMYIITNDLVGTKLAKQAGITVYDKIDQGLTPHNFESENLKRPIKISPLKAAKNIFGEEAPTKLAQKKVSINEIVNSNKEKQQPFSITDYLFSFFHRSNKKRGGFSWLKNLPAFFLGNRGALGLLILISFFVLLLISYIALPGATIYLTPAASVLDKSSNVILADKDKNKAELETRAGNMISAYRIALPVPIKKTFTYNSTGTLFKGANAKGSVTLINKRPSPWQLVAKTRLQTTEGLIFRLQKNITVPAATAKNSGTIEAEVIADEYDIYSKPVGEKGNIGPTKFFLPGLRESNREQLYAESKGMMVGGKTDVIKIVSKEDLASAHEKARQEIIAAIIPSLEEIVTTMNKEDKTDLRLLTENNIDWKRAIKYGDPKITIPSKLEGEPMPTFEVTAEITASGYAYRQSDLVSLLKSNLKLTKSPEKKILKIDDNSVTYRLVEEEPIQGKFKITATIKGIEQYEIDPKTENGARLIKKIKEHILGKEIKEANNYMQNLPEIHKVEIKCWPIWAPTIPTVMDNIEVKMVE